MNKIIPTKRSLDEVEYIAKTMDGFTFHHHYHILWDIRDLIDKEEINYLEIGTYCGASSSLMLRHPKKTNVFAVDMVESEYHQHVESNVKKFKKNGGKFEYILGNSRERETVNKVRDKVDGIDIFFIDGEHTMEAVLDDFINYKDLVNKGGFIVFDDYHDLLWCPQVKHGVDYIVNELLFNDYEVWGFVYNKLKASPDTMMYNNEFVIRRKL